MQTSTKPKVVLQSKTVDSSLYLTSTGYTFELLKGGKVGQ